jgi:hypothetical protein
VDGDQAVGRQQRPDGLDDPMEVVGVREHVVGGDQRRLPALGLQALGQRGRHEFRDGRDAAARGLLGDGARGVDAQHLHPRLLKAPQQHAVVAADLHDLRAGPHPGQRAHRLGVAPEVLDEHRRGRGYVHVIAEQSLGADDVAQLRVAAGLA